MVNKHSIILEQGAICIVQVLFCRVRLADKAELGGGGVGLTRYERKCCWGMTPPLCKMSCRVDM